MGEQFFLKWNNHQNTLIGVFDSLLGTEKYADCILAAEGKVLRAHKVVLTACSPYLEYLLNQQGTDKHPILIFNDIKFDELKSMLDYMYKGEVNVLQEQFNSFLKAAKSLQVKGLTDQSGNQPGGDAEKCEEMKKEPITTKTPEVNHPGSPGDRSMLPAPVKRKRKRRPSQDQPDPPVVNNSCDNSQPTNLAITKTKIETDRVSNVQMAHDPAPPIHNPPPAHILQAKTEPTELLVQPKTEFMDNANDDQPVEDLTLDDEEEEEDMNYMTNPGTSIGENSQDYTMGWQMGEPGNESFLSQEGMGNQNNSQVSDWKPEPEENSRSAVNRTGLKAFSCKYCDKSYDKVHVLIRHQKYECEGVSRKKCEFCPFVTMCKKTLIQHIKKHHLAKFLHKKRVQMELKTSTEKKKPERI